MRSTLHDERERGWFHMDNAVVDAYLPLVGHTAFAVYAYLVRNVSRERGYAFPSYTRMQRGLGIGRNQVAESIKRLCDHDLIRVEQGDRGGVNHYHITSVGSLDTKLVSPENQSRSETETSFQEKPKLVSERDSIKTYLKRPIEKDRVKESVKAYPGVPARAHETAVFSPKNSSLTDAEIAEDAAACGTTPAIFRGYIPQWADSRKTQGATSADWRADLRKFVRAAVEVAAGRAAGQQSNGARASPEPFATAGMRMTSESLDTVLAARKEFERGRSGVSGGDDGADGRLSARVRADAGGDGGLAETPRRP
jgi:hypothetical protein